jgi:hypothetical protein
MGREKGRMRNMKMNKDYVEQEYRRGLERGIAYILQESVWECAEELLGKKGLCGNTLLEDIVEDVEKNAYCGRMNYDKYDVRIAIGRTLISRLQELEDIGKDKLVPEGQKNWTICISNSEGYPASFMHFEGTAEEVQDALIQLAAEDRAKAPDEYECGGDPEDIGVFNNGFYDIHVAYKDYRIDYTAVEETEIEVLPRDVLDREMPSFEKEYELLATYPNQNMDGEPITAQFDTIADFIRIMESEEYDIPRPDDGPVQAVFSSNRTDVLQFGDISELLDYCRDILEEREQDSREEGYDR